MLGLGGHAIATGNLADLHAAIAGVVLGDEGVDHVAHFGLDPLIFGGRFLFALLLLGLRLDVFDRGCFDCGRIRFGSGFDRGFRFDGSRVSRRQRLLPLEPCLLRAR